MSPQKLARSTPKTRRHHQPARRQSRADVFRPRLITAIRRIRPTERPHSVRSAPSLISDRARAQAFGHIGQCQGPRSCVRLQSASDPSGCGRWEGCRVQPVCRAQRTRAMLNRAFTPLRTASANGAAPPPRLGGLNPPLSHPECRSPGLARLPSFFSSSPGEWVRTYAC